MTVKLYLFLDKVKYPISPIPHEQYSYISVSNSMRCKQPKRKRNVNTTARIFSEKSFIVSRMERGERDPQTR